MDAGWNRWRAFYDPERGAVNRTFVVGAEGLEPPTSAL